MSLPTVTHFLAVTGSLHCFCTSVSLRGSSCCLSVSFSVKTGCFLEKGTRSPPTWSICTRTVPGDEQCSWPARGCLVCALTQPSPRTQTPGLMRSTVTACAGTPQAWGPFDGSWCSTASRWHGAVIVPGPWSAWLSLCLGLGPRRRLRTLVLL